MRKQKKHLIGLLILLCSYYSKAQKFEVDTIQYHGSTKNLVNLVILSDGYTALELGKFVKDAAVFKDYLFSEHPFSRYKNYFNVFAIRVPSAESGVIHSNEIDDCPKGTVPDSVRAAGNRLGSRVPMAASHPKTYFGSSFDNNGLHRLVVAHNQEAIRQVLKDNFPEYSQALILVNSPYYGGSGGTFPTATLNKSSNGIAIHELGHSFASLADEYWSGLQFLSEVPNRSQYGTPSEVPWSRWIGTDGVGVYNYGGSAPRSVWYRPHEFCKMQYLIAPFCAVCSETIIEKIHDLTNPIIGTAPDTAVVLKADSLKIFQIRLNKPDPNTLKTEWYLNNILIARNSDSIRIDPGLLAEGNNVLSCKVSDTTLMVRTEDHHAHLYSVNWTITNSQTALLKDPQVRWGDTLQTCYGGNTVLSVRDQQAGLTYKWYKSASAKKALWTGYNFQTPLLFKEATYYLEGSFKKQKTKRIPVFVKVLDQVTEPITEISDSIADTLTLSISNPDPTLSYRWYKSEKDLKPISNRGPFADPDITINREGTVLKVINRGNDRYFYVEARSKTSTCSSTRKAVYIKGARIASGK